MKSTLIYILATVGLLGALSPYPFMMAYPTMHPILMVGLVATSFIYLFIFSASLKMAIITENAEYETKAEATA